MRYEDLVKKVDVLEKDAELGECIYYGAIEKLESVREDLSTLDDVEHVKRVVKPFLIQWGMMGRVVGRKNVDWKKLGETLRELKNDFYTIRNNRLLTIDLTDQIIIQAIRTTYSQIRKIPYLGGQTCVTKILHLINPEVFVMWDYDIKKDYKSRNNRISGSAQGYLEFLKEVQKEIRDVLTERGREIRQPIDDIETDLRNRYNGKTLARIVDEYNWIKVHPA